MRKPDMILFDYGSTLVFEPRFDKERGFSAVLEFCIENPNHITAAMLSKAYEAILKRLSEMDRAANADYMDMALKRMMYEERKLRFSLDYVKLERVFWDAAGSGHAMPGAVKTLERLRKQGIRLGIVSNMNFRESNLAERVNRYLPGIDFEFVLCSCEYATRKPNPDYFHLALVKAALSPEQVWFCGDNPLCDIQGAADAGLFPIWYQDPVLFCAYQANKDRIQPDCDYMVIHSLSELADHMEAF